MSLLVAFVALHCFLVFSRTGLFLWLPSEPLPCVLPCSCFPFTYRPSSYELPTTFYLCWEWDISATCITSRPIESSSTLRLSPNVHKKKAKNTTKYMSYLILNLHLQPFQIDDNFIEDIYMLLEIQTLLYLQEVHLCFRYNFFFRNFDMYWLYSFFHTSPGDVNSITW